VTERFDPARLARRDLRRLVGEMWADPRCAHLAPAVLDTAVAGNAKSLDRAVLTAYLRHFPTGHAAFDRLRLASQLTAERRDWPWRTRGREWRLWSRQDGPARLARALLDHPDAAAVLRDAGLDGDLAQGAFVAGALSEACAQAAGAKGAAAVDLGGKLIDLFERMGIAGTDALLAWALLAPWRERDPPVDYQERVAKLLVNRLGDPRLTRLRWDAAISEMHDHEASRLVERLRKWLVRSTVEQFFKIIARTTDNPNQWAQRTAFWTSYLRENMIDDAWFVLGPRAKDLFRAYADVDLRHGSIRAGDGGAGHSALVMAMGDLRIAEWSDNGSCRFWPSNHPEAPELGQPVYLRSKLKARNGERGFEKKAHLPSPGWEPKFARKIYSATSLRHPQHGAGY
jgi:hypothetical protein